VLHLARLRRLGDSRILRRVGHKLRRLQVSHERLKNCWIEVVFGANGGDRLLESFRIAYYRRNYSVQGLSGSGGLGRRYVRLTEGERPRAWGTRVTGGNPVRGVVRLRTSVQATLNVYSKSGVRIADLHSSADIPRPADEAPVFINAVSTEWEPTSIKRLRKKKVRTCLDPNGWTNFWHNSRAGISTG
jgi:hypothetical protein